MRFLGEDRRYSLALALLLLAALGLRLVGLHHGAPASVSGDERLVCTDAVGLIARGTLQPGHYNYPAAYTYLFSAALFLYYLAGGIWELGSASDAVGFAWFFAPSSVFMVGRLLSLLAGVGLVAATFLLGRRAYGRPAALAAGAAVAMSPLLVDCSQSALPEATMALLAILACLCQLDMAQRGRRVSYLLAGLCAGLAISTKYNAGMVLGGMVAAHLLRVREERGAWWDSRVLLAGSGLAAAFFLGSPYWLITPGRYYQAVLDVSSNLQFSLEPATWPRLRLLADFWRAEWGWGVLGTLGCLYGLWRRTPADWVLLAIILPAFLYVGSWPKGGLHYLIYLLPLLSLMGARLLLAPGRRYPLLGPAVLALALAAGGYRSLSAGYQKSREDVRTIAARWIEEHLPGGTTIGGYSSDYHPPLKRVEVEQRVLAGLLQAKSASPTLVAGLRAIERQSRFYRWIDLEYYLPDTYVPPEYQGRIDFSDPKTKRIFGRTYMPYEEMKQKGVEYVILPEAAYGRFLSDRLPVPGTPAYYHFVRNRDYIRQFFASPDRYRLVQEFAAPDGGPGSRIVLFQVR